MVWFLFLVKRSYWANFHINIITSSEVMKVFFCKGLIWNPEIRNTPVSIFPMVWRLRNLGIPNKRANISNEMLLRAAKSQGYSFYGFWIIKGRSHQHADWFSSNSAYLNNSKHNPLSLSDDFSFLDQIFLTKKSLILKKKFEHYHQIQHVGTNLST